MLDQRIRHVVLAAVGMSWSSVAFALPWNIDMTDSDTVKGYEQAMRRLPDGVIAQPNVLTPIGYTRNLVRESPEGQALTNPHPVDAALLATGERMYGIYCTPCHGDGINLGPVAAPGRYPGVAVLAGPDGRLKSKSDGHVYFTIRNGGGIMPSYGWAMNDREMWALVAWMRKGLPDSAAPAPANPTPAPTALPADGAPAAPAPGAPAPAPAKEGSK